MASFRSRPGRAVRLFACAIGLWSVVAIAPPALALEKPRLIIVAMPRGEAELFLNDNTAAVGVGVFPDSLDPARFVREIGVGAPIGRGSAEELGGRAGKLGQALTGAGFTVGLAAGGPQHVQAALAFALSPDPVHPVTSARDAALQADVVGLWMDTKNELDTLLATLQRNVGVMILGLDKRTPVLVGVLTKRASRSLPGGVEGGWLLTDGIARRPGIATPYDVAAMILTNSSAALPIGLQLPFNGGVKLRVPGDGFIGRAMRFDPPSDETQPSALGEVRRIEDRLVRDVSYRSALAMIVDWIALGSIVIGLILWRAGRRDIAVRAAHGAWFAVAGHMGALFIPSGRAEIRAIAVVAGLLLGYSVNPRDPVKHFGRAALGLSVAFAVLVAIAPLRPGGEPGLSIWGNPLISWRFFGLQNVEAAFIAGGVVAGGVLAGLPALAYAACAALVAVVIGAPAIGANFVGVLTFAFGAALGVIALVRRRVEMWHVIAAGAVAVGAFVLSLLADAGSPVSHGGTAARRISEGGASVAFGFVRARLRLNIDMTREFFGGVVIAPLLLVALIALTAWAARASGAPLRGRVAVWAGGAMALSSLVLEDSGFFTGAALALIAVAAYMVVSASAADVSVSSPGAPQHAGDG